MRQRYVVTYDVCDQRRLRKVFKILKGYGVHLQFSVFRCDLSRMSLATMKHSLLDAIDPSKDQVLIIDIGPASGRGAEVIESLGIAYKDEASRAIVV